MEPLYRAIETIVMPVLNVWFKLDVAGTEHLPPQGPTILASNHMSYADPFAIGWMLRGRGRRGRFLAKSELYKNPLLRVLLSGMGHIPVYRGTDTAGSALRDAEAALGAKRDVVIYPEATIGPGLPLLPFKTGAARLALATGVPITPMATWYAKRLRPRTTLKVAIGESLAPDGDADTLTAALREAMTSLVEQVSCVS